MERKIQRNLEPLQLHLSNVFTQLDHMSKKYYSYATQLITNL